MSTMIDIGDIPLAAYLAENPMSAAAYLADRLPEAKMLETALNNSGIPFARITKLGRGYRVDGHQCDTTYSLISYLIARYPYHVERMMSEKTIH